MFDYQSPTYVSEDYLDSSDSDEGHGRDFPPSTKKPDVPEEDMANPQPDRPTGPFSTPKWRSIQTMYNPDLDCDDLIFHVGEDIAQCSNKYWFIVLTDVQFGKVTKLKMNFWTHLG